MRTGTETPPMYTFGPYRLDPSERLLSRDGTALALTPKAFDLLVYLVERHGRLVEKTTLMSALWPDTIVEEANVAYTVSILRKLLDQGEDTPSVIQTVPTRGYRFIAPVTISPRTEASRAQPEEPTRLRPYGIEPQGSSLQASPDDLTAPGSENGTDGAVVRTVRPTPWRRLLPGAILAIIGVGVAWVLVMGRWSPTTTLAPAPLRLSVELGGDGTLPSGDATFALSHDGSRLAFIARRPGGVPQLHVRDLDQVTASPIAGTDGASSPFFSPDGHWLAFFAEMKLKKVPVTGGGVVTLAEAPNPRGGWWADDGTIVFAPHYRRSLMRVSAVGGRAQPLTTLVDKEITHRWPQVLPGGGAVLYTASTEVNIGNGATLVVQRLPSGERTIVQRGGYFGRYLASGHIVYMQGDTLFAAPFDDQRLAVTGPAARAIDGVRSDSSRGGAQLALSQAGTLAYLPGQNALGPRPVAWMDRTGTMRILRATAADWSNPEFSPDGQRIAMDIRTEGHSDIWVYEWSRDALSRLTSERTNEQRPVWSPDGKRIVYRSFTSSSVVSGNALSWRRADGGGEEQVLIRSAGALVPGSWHPTKNVLAYVATMPTTGQDVMLLPIEGDDVHGWKAGQPMAFANSTANERGPAFSPDGKWLAYYSNSNESGRDDVYVQPFPGRGARVIVSSDQSSERPSWSRTRRELVFTTASVDYARLLMVAPYVVEAGAFRAGKPQPWAQRGSLRNLADERIYALHPDGIRVAVAPPGDDEDVAKNHVTLVLNFFDELRRIAPKPSR